VTAEFIVVVVAGAEDHGDPLIDGGEDHLGQGIVLQSPCRRLASPQSAAVADHQRSVDLTPSLEFGEMLVDVVPVGLSLVVEGRGELPLLGSALSLQDVVGCRHRAIVRLLDPVRRHDQNPRVLGVDVAEDTQNPGELDPQGGLSVVHVLSSGL
jgi:hypothetical protein